MGNKNIPTHARCATLDELIRDTLPNFISPLPCRETIRDWLDRAKVPRFKANPIAKRGGGPCFYSVSHVENLLRSRTMAPPRRAA